MAPGGSSNGNASKTGAPGFQTTPGAVALVTGSTGLVGARLVEMLLERGASKVLCFDVAAPTDTVISRFQSASKGDESKYAIFSGTTDGNLTNPDAVNAAFKSVTQVDVVYHIAALVGPFHDRSKYMDVNYNGTLHIINACKTYKVPRLVFSSSPSTRFTGADIEGLREDQMDIPDTFLALYAESKAYAEQEVSKACCDELMTVSVAPHQVYGPHDALFLPSLLETAGNGRLRIFGKGENKISVCYVDNYCHGLMCGADSLRKDSPSLGKFYIVTDGPEQYFWKILNDAVVAMGFTDLYTKFHLPTWFLMGLAYAANVVGFVTNRKLKLNPFNVKMLTIHRYFSIDNARKELMYEPLVEFDKGWSSTIEWYKVNWLPGYLEKKAGSSKRKSD